MRRLEVYKYGQLTDSVRFAEAADPIAGPTDVVIDIAAASINPIDYKFVNGAMRRFQAVEFPAAFGFDCSGTVSAAGSGVTGFAVGDKVFARAPRQRMGSFAERVVIDAKLVAYAPKSISLAEAAALPLVALTTVQGLVDRARAQPGQSILIHAGSGGLGSFIVQYAKHVLQLHVTTTTSSRNQDWVAQLGADKVISYDKEDYLASGDRYDIVFDTLGGKTTIDAFKALKRGGVLVSVGGPPDRWFAKQVSASGVAAIAMFMMSFPVRARARLHSIDYYRFLTESNGLQLRHIAEIVDKGFVKPVIDRQYAFNQIIQAFEYVQTGHAKGKVIIDMF
jgi:alcohol dehydrogenase